MAVGRSQTVTREVFTLELDSDEAALIKFILGRRVVGGSKWRRVSDGIFDALGSFPHSDIGCTGQLTLVDPIEF